MGLGLENSEPSWCLIRQGLGRATERASASVSQVKCGAAAERGGGLVTKDTEKAEGLTELFSSFSPGNTSLQLAQVRGASEKV